MFILKVTEPSPLRDSPCVLSVCHRVYRAFIFNLKVTGPSSPGCGWTSLSLRHGAARTLDFLLRYQVSFTTSLILYERGIHSMP
jgi:hypothetical protein